jgi:predicted aldo/keto reductase-like oxidoreductase
MREMQKRKLGRTGLQLSIIGFGGFHLIEVPKEEASFLLNTYLDNGGNYIETAAQYGEGISEKKVGYALASRRDELVLATKTTARTRDGALASLEQSLKHLRTDHVDIFFMHEPQTVEESEQILAPGGAMEAVHTARDAGKVLFVGISGHGRPAGILHAIQNLSYDVLMTGFNYFDHFNFPQIEDELLPLCHKRGTGVLGMKALADGYLYRNPVQAIRYVLSLPIASLVLGINSRAYLEQDLNIANNFSPMTEEEKTHLYETAPELGTYVCRLCGKCSDGAGLNPLDVFLLEGLVDRQMESFEAVDPAQYALQERFKHWFDQAAWAQREYENLKDKVDPARDYSSLNKLCPYGINIDRKLKIAHAKLLPNEYIY